MKIGDIGTPTPEYKRFLEFGIPLNVNCEQEHCRGQGKDAQFYCANHSMEICSICRFAHQECEQAGLLLRGSRIENDNIVIGLEQKLDTSE